MNNNLKMKNNLASFISFIALALLAQVAFGGHREVSVLRCVQEGETIASVELSVSPGAEPVLLGVVRDAVDRGSDPADWAAYDPVVAEFPASEAVTTYVYTPAKPDKVYRFLPSVYSPAYKAKLDYLRATGTQFVLTDYNPHDGIKVRAEVTLDAMTADGALWGARTKPGQDASVLFRCSGSKGGALRYDTANSNSSYSSTVPEQGVKHTFVASGASLTCEDCDVTCSSSAGEFATPCPLALFAVNNNGSVATFSKCRIHSFLLWDIKDDDKSLVLDLVPCIREDDSFAFYNRKSGKFFTTPVGGDALVASETTYPCEDLKVQILSMTDPVTATTDNLLANGGFENAGETEESALGWTGGVRVAGKTSYCPSATEEGRYALALLATSAPQAQASFMADSDGLYRLSLKLTTSQLDWVAAVNLKAYLDDQEIHVDSAYAFRHIGWNEVVFGDMQLAAGTHTLKLKAVRVVGSGDPVLTVDDVRLAQTVKPSPANGFSSSFNGIPEGAPTGGLLSQPDKLLCEVGEIVLISARRFLFGGKVYGATSVTVSVGGDVQTIDGAAYVYRAVAGRELTQLTWNYAEVSVVDGNILPNPSFEEETVCEGDRVSNVSPYFTKAWRGGIVNRGNGQVYCKIPMVDGSFGMALNNWDGVDAELGAFSCSFDVAEEGAYHLSFFLMARSSSCCHCVDVSIDGGDPVCTATPESTTSWTYSSTPGIYLSKGSHTITFAGRRLAGAGSADATTLDLVSLQKETVVEGLGYHSSFGGIDDVGKARSALSSPDLASGPYGMTFTVTASPVVSHHNLYAVESIDVTVGGVTKRIVGNAYQHLFLKDEVTDVKWNFVAQSLLPNPSFEEETVIKDNGGDRGINGANGNFTRAWSGGQINRGPGNVMCYQHPMADGTYGIALFDSATEDYTRLSCAFDLDGEGLYELSFQVCARGNDAAFYTGTTIDVAFDGAEDPLLTVRPTSPRDWDTCTCRVKLAPGSHSIMFRAKKGEAAGTIIDNVVLKMVKPRNNGLIIFVR